jgi:hypothetical protein
MNQPTETPGHESEAAAKASASPVVAILALGFAALLVFALAYRQPPPIAAHLTWPLGFL